MVILIEILEIILVAFLMFLIIVYTFIFDSINVQQKVIQKVRNYKNMLKNKIITKWKV